VSAAILLVIAGTIAVESKDAPASVLDSGSFGIFMNGKRVATETFSVQQLGSGMSTASSQLKEEMPGGPGKVLNYKSCPMEPSSGTNGEN
jgi:hypothetical protein